MAGLPWAITAGGEVTLTAGATKTILQVVAPTNQRVQVNGFSISFQGVSPTAEQIIIRLARQTTAGTMTAVTPVKDDDSLPETIQSTAQKNATAEPTTTDVLREFYVHPQGGYERAFGPKEVMIKGGGRLGLLVVTPTGVNPDCVATMSCEE